MKLTGAQIILRKLTENKVKIVFEFPGGSLCPVLDELYKHKAIKMVCFRHEQAAIHAADAYARIAGCPSVCMATSGPGASNLVTGIANAYMDSVPVVVITGQVAVWDLKGDRQVRQRGFQELDIVSLVKSITKAAFIVNDVSDLSEILSKAFFIAKEGRPGPVLVDVPVNVQYSLCEYKKSKERLNRKKLTCSKALVRDIAKKFVMSKNPLVLAGGGVILASAGDRLSRFVREYKIPLVETLMGVTAVSSDYDFNLGLVGYAGSRLAQSAVAQADFVLGLGLRFDNRAFPDGKKEFSKNAHIVQVDCDRHEMNHRVKVNQAVLADADLFLRDFIFELKKLEYKPKYEWLKQIMSWKEEYPVLRKNKLSAAFIMDSLSKMLKNKNAVITTDVGQHQLWAAQHFKFTKVKSFITSGGLGTMGFGLPAAIGAQFSDSNALVFNITSDGSFQMNIQELATVIDYKLPVKIVLFNNKCLGLVRQIQEFAFCSRYASTRVNSNVDFVKIAKAYGIDAFSVNAPRAVVGAIKRVVNSRKSIMVEFNIDEFENVFPVRIKGKTIYDSAKS